jgi:hypothetical protein
MITMGALDRICKGGLARHQRAWKLVDEKGRNRAHVENNGGFYISRGRFDEVEATFCSILLFNIRKASKLGFHNISC